MPCIRFISHTLFQEGRQFLPSRLLRSDSALNTNHLEVTRLERWWNPGWKTLRRRWMDKRDGIYREEKDSLDGNFDNLPHHTNDSILLGLRNNAL